MLDCSRLKVCRQFDSLSRSPPKGHGTNGPGVDSKPPVDCVYHSQAVTPSGQCSGMSGDVQICSLASAFGTPLSEKDVHKSIICINHRVKITHHDYCKF